MVKFNPGDRITLVIGEKGLDTDDASVQNLLTRLGRAGLSLEENPELFVTNIDDFAALSPITSRSSFLGAEHFRTLGSRLGLHSTVRLHVFDRVIDPYSGLDENDEQLVEKAARIKDFYEEHEIVTRSRAAAGLPEIPAKLRRDHKPTEKMAVQADSILELTKHIDEFCLLVDGLGKRAAEKFPLIRDDILRSIKSYRDNL